MAQHKIIRLDWLLRAAGLIRPAQVFSAFVIGDTLYLLHVGRGWARLGVSEGAFQGMADNIARANQAKVQANLDILDQTDIAAEIPARAEFAYRLSDIAEVKAHERGVNGTTSIKLKAQGKGPGSLSLQAIDYLAGRDARNALLAALPNVKMTQTA